jgi:dipeptidyl aminopeptidase/acylaminoacyl peptidase
MPWDECRIHVAHLDLGLSEPKIVDQDLAFSVPNCSSFQPEFSPNGRFLSFVSNSGGWGNLRIVSLPDFDPVVTVEDDAEHALPAWIHGMRTYGWAPDSQRIYFLRSQDATTRLASYDLGEACFSEISGEIEDYSSLGQIAVCPSSEQIAMFASAADLPRRLVLVSGDGTVEVCRKSNPELLPRRSLARSHPVKWTGTAGTDIHGLFTPPHNPHFTSRGLPPAIIKIHGGPTSQYVADFDSETQFFATRGYAVFALNHRGSTGYGEAFRTSLRRQWGLADVEDAKSAAELLSANRLIDPDRIVIMGGSAGGFTALLCLIRYPGWFRAGVCRYPVTDLLAAARCTHKFEAHYFDFLVGHLPEEEETYRLRSPSELAGGIVDPVALFHGCEDRVVPPSQSEVIAASLRARGIPHIYEVFAGEGHGWRRQENVLAYYQALEAFLDQYVLRETP